MFATEINPGDRVTFFAVWNKPLGTYVAIKVEATQDLPMKIFLSEHGPTVSLNPKEQQVYASFIDQSQSSPSE